MNTLLAHVTYYDYDADRLIKARKAAGLSQEEAAEKANMHGVTLCRIEKKRSASYDTVARLCQFYGLSLSDVLSPVAVSSNLPPYRNNFLRKPTPRVEIA